MVENRNWEAQASKKAEYWKVNSAVATLLGYPLAISLIFRGVYFGQYFEIAAVVAFVVMWIATIVVSNFTYKFVFDHEMRKFRELQQQEKG